MATPQIKDEETYQALRREGASKEKAARIANSAARGSRSAVEVRGAAPPGPTSGVPVTTCTRRRRRSVSRGGRR